jgi:hypothetical protein
MLPYWAEDPRTKDKKKQKQLNIALSFGHRS